MWQLHSRSSRLRAACKEYKRACCIEDIMNIKYLLYSLPWPLSMIAFSTALFARMITCIGRHVDNHPSRSRRSPLWLKQLLIDIRNEDQQSAESLYCKFTLLKIFREFNFCYWLDQPKHFKFSVTITKMVAGNCNSCNIKPILKQLRRDNPITSHLCLCRSQQCPFFFLVLRLTELQVKRKWCTIFKYVLTHPSMYRIKPDYISKSVWMVKPLSAYKCQSITLMGQLFSWKLF